MTLLFFDEILINSSLLRRAKIATILTDSLNIAIPIHTPKTHVPIINNITICYYEQVNSLRLKSSVASKWPSKQRWGYHLFSC